jgi:hypothetical protein
MHVYEVRPRKDHRVDLISDALPFGGLWYGGPNAASNVRAVDGQRTVLLGGRWFSSQQSEWRLQ